MYFLKPIFDFSWKNIGKMDEKRIASQTPTPGITEITDISYIDDGEKAHLLDIYYPEGTASPLPVIIDIHGGGWMYGYKEINKYFCLKLAQKGFCVASINYRLADGKIFIDGQIRDVFGALTWLSKNLKDYPADLNNVFIAGDSAGGHLALTAAAVNLSADLQKDFGVSYSGLDFKAVGAISPAVDLLNGSASMKLMLPMLLGEKYRSSRFYKYMNVGNVITSQMPPVYIMTSTGDMVRSHAYKLEKYLKAKDIPCRLRDFTEKPNGKKLQHVFSVVDPYSKPGDTANSEMTDFFKVLIK